MTDDTDYILDDLRRNPRVCSNCWRLRHTETPVPSRVEALAKRTVWASAVTPEWTQTRHADTDSPPGECVSDRKPTSVCECGAVSPFTLIHRAPDHPLEKDRAIRFTHHLTATLDALAIGACEAGDDRLAATYAHDTDALFDAVRHLHSKPKYNYRGCDIFTVAVEVACNRKENPPCGTIDSETVRTG